ncbi:MAG: glycosyltransferase [Clostridiales bacterium]|nr:glycosyltransferase [Clostridiales bacterium]
MRGLNNATAANEKRWQTVAEQERRDYSALQKAVAAANATAADRDKRNYEQLRDSITKANQTAAERERQDYSKLMRQIGDNRYQLSRKDEYYYFKGLEPSRYPDALKEWYYQKTGQTLNLEHPRTYTEKIQWLKLHDSTPLKGELSDKYLVRNYVKQKIGEEYLVPLLGVWDRAEDIPFDALPVRFALKATHGSGWNIIVHDKSSLNVADARRKLNEWLQTNFAFYAGLELHYGYIKPRIIAEEYIENSGGDIDDYKVFCFDGKPRYILFITGRHTHMEKAVYDTDRNRMPFLDGGRPLERDVSKPAFLSKLLSLAEALSQGFIHVRVDFYCLNSGQLKFGEMTFTPTSGRSLWEPAEYERILGDLIHLPCDDQPQE